MYGQDRPSPRRTMPWLRAARGSISHWRRLERAQRCCTRARSARKAALWPICCGNPVRIPLLREVDGPSGHAVIEINAAGQNRIIVFGGANRRETREYIERVLDTAQPDDWVLLQNEVNLVPEIIRRAHEKGLRVVFNPSPVP